MSGEVEGQRQLSSHSFYLSMFEKIYHIIGISFYSKRGVKMNLLYLFFIYRVISAMIANVHFALGLNSSSMYKTLISNQIMFTIPALEYLYLILNLCKLTSSIDCFMSNLNINISDSRAYIANVRRMSLFCAIAIIVRLTIQMIPAVRAFNETNNFMVQRAFLQSLPHIVASTLGFIMYSIEDFSMSFIFLSTSIYLIFFKILISIKLILLKKMNQCNISSVLWQLDRLEDLSTMFDSILSPLPFDWMNFCLSGSLVIVLSVYKVLPSSVDLTVYYVAQAVDICITLISLFLICKWQEHLDFEVDRVLRPWQSASTNYQTDKILKRIKAVMKTRVTVWHIFNIDRSLILAYIGSAVTFSTLFMQIDMQPW